MTEKSSFRWVDVAGFFLVLAVAGGLRAGYVYAVGPDVPEARLPFAAQDRWPEAPAAGSGTATQLDRLVANLNTNGFKGPAPLGRADPQTGDEEETAHIAPGYPFAVALAHRAAGAERAVEVIRWSQCALGALAAALLFVFARRAFGSLPVALLAGLLAATNPFWIVNVAEVNDGVLASFLVALCLALGARAGGWLPSLALGLALAGMALVRAALLPFAFVGLLWFLLQCRTIPKGWLCAILAVLGFVNGIATWSVYNYQRFGDIVPVVDSAFLHLWIGNSPNAKGGPLTEKELREPLGEKRLAELLAEPKQNRRYQMLAHDVAAFVRDQPDAAVRNRLRALLYFYFGQKWFADDSPGVSGAAPEGLPQWLSAHAALLLNAVLLGMLVLGLLGWRWSHRWSPAAGLAALAAVWLPLPYVLSHAEQLWGPRLPLDGVLLSYAAFAVVYLLGGAASPPQTEPTKES